MAPPPRLLIGAIASAPAGLLIGGIASAPAGAFIGWRFAQPIKKPYILARPPPIQVLSINCTENEDDHHSLG